MLSGIRVKRRLFNFAAAVSLVLFVAIVALWARSALEYDALVLNLYREPNQFRSYVLAANHGRLFVMYANYRFAEERPKPDHRFDYASTARNDFKVDPRGGLDNVHWGWFFRRSGSDSIGNVWSEYQAIVPFWELVLLSAAGPSVRFRRAYLAARERRRRAMNYCAKCGYDLRATPDRCPECGTAATSTAEAA